MPKNTARPDESEWRNIESGEVSYTKDFEIDRIFNFEAFKLEGQPFIKIVKLKNLLKALDKYTGVRFPMVRLNTAQRGIRMNWQSGRRTPRYLILLALSESFVKKIVGGRDCSLPANVLYNFCHKLPCLIGQMEHLTSLLFRYRL